MSKVHEAIASLKSALTALTASAAWFDPSPADQLQFCKDTGFPPEYAGGWPGGDTPNAPNTWQAKIAPLPADASDDQLKRYHAMGFARDGRRRSWTKMMLDKARSDSYLVAQATSPEQADLVFPGAGGFQPDVTAMLFMGQGAQPAAFYGPLLTNQSIANAANYCVGAPIVYVSGPTGTPAGPGV